MSDDTKTLAKSRVRPAKNAKPIAPLSRLPGPSAREALAEKISKEFPAIITARSDGGQAWHTFLEPPANPNTWSEAKRVRAQTERLKKQCLVRLKKAGIEAGAPDPKEAVNYYLRLQWNEIVPQLHAPKEQRRDFKVSGVVLPAETWARSIDGSRFKVSVRNRPHISAPERERIDRKSETLLEKFRKAIDEPDRDSVFNCLWNDPNLRTGPSDPRFRLSCWQEKDGSFTEQRIIQDVGSVLVQYCKVYWRPAPTSSKTERPGRRKGFAMRSKIRELRNRLGLTQGLLGEACKPAVSARSIMRAEQGHRMAEGFPENLAATFTRLGIRVDARDLLTK